MKKTITKSRLLSITVKALLCMTLVTVPSVRTLAGDINSEEARVIGAASGTFYYNNEAYRAYDTYISQLSAYLAQDGVDLDASQADAAISEIYANVANGIAQGYLYKVEEDTETSTEDAEDKDIDTVTTEISDDLKEKQEATDSTEKISEASPTTENKSTTAEASTTQDVDENVSLKAEEENVQEDSVSTILKEVGAEEVKVNQPDKDKTSSNLYFDAEDNIITYYNKDTDKEITFPSIMYPADLTPYTNMITIILLIITAIILMFTAILFLGKCFSWQRKKRNRRSAKYYVNHRIRNRIRSVVGNTFTVFLAAHICVCLLLAGTSVSLFRNQFVTDHLTSSGYYRYIYNELQRETARELGAYNQSDVIMMLSTVSYDRYLKQAKLQVMESLKGNTAFFDGDSLREELLELSLSDMTEEEQAFAASIIVGNVMVYTSDVIGSSIYGIKHGCAELIGQNLWIMMLNMLIMISVMFMMERHKHRGVRYLSRGMIGGSVITILLVGCMVLLKPYTKIYMEPEYLFLFLADYLNRGFIVVLSVGCIGLLAGLGLHMLVEVVRKAQMNKD